MRCPSRPGESSTGHLLTGRIRPSVKQSLRIDSAQGFAKDLLHNR